MIGDLFSKYIEVIPLRDQTASTITSALWGKWIMKYGSPKFLLTDQGSNVDGSILAKLCQGFNIEKRRTSGYHSQCNGFAERNIRSVKELFRTALIEFQLPQIMWKDILPSIVFALNTSVNASTNCAPYTVIYGRQPRLPIDILLDVDVKQMSAPNPTEYLKDMKIQIRDILSHVSKNLNISRMSMMRQYNKNVKFFDYQAGDKVWVKRRHYKPGENRKLSPRNTGPWTIELKKSNGVNYEIKNNRNQRKVIHHDRLLPYRTNENNSPKELTAGSPPPVTVENVYSSSESSSEGSSESCDTDQRENEILSPRYPRRERRQRLLEGYIPWDIIEHHL